MHYSIVLEYVVIAINIWKGKNSLSISVFKFYILRRKKSHRSLDLILIRSPLLYGKNENTSTPLLLLLMYL